VRGGAVRAEVAATGDRADGGVRLVLAGRAVDVRLQVDRLGDGDGGADPFLDGVDAGRDLRSGIRGADSDLRGDEQRIRADVHGPQMDNPLGLRAVLDRGHDRPLGLRTSRLADQEALRLHREDRRRRGQQQADSQ